MASIPPTSFTVILVVYASCDGNRLGKAWKTKGFLTLEAAADQVREWTPRWQGKFPGKDTEWVEEVVDGKRGYVRWRTGSMVYIEELSVPLPKGVSIVSEA